MRALRRIWRETGIGLLWHFGIGVGFATLLRGWLTGSDSVMALGLGAIVVCRLEDVARHLRTDARQREAMLDHILSSLLDRD